MDRVAQSRLRWKCRRGLLELGRAELFPTDTYYCSDCPFRLPMPEVGHDGCAVGRLVPLTEEATA